LKSFELKARKIFTNFVPVQWAILLAFYASFMIKVNTFNLKIRTHTLTL
jgi:hypothetical protein